MVLYRITLNQHPMVVPSSAEKLEVSGVLFMLVHGSASIAALALSFKVPYPLADSKGMV
jgi:hypothetical protein